MANLVGKCVSTEASNIVKRSETLLKVTSIDDILNFDWQQTEEHMKMKMPVLMDVLHCFKEKKTSAVPHLVTAVSILLYARNQQINLLQLLLGTVLDGCGLTKEVVDNFSHTSVFIKCPFCICIQKRRQNLSFF